MATLGQTGGHTRPISSSPSWLKPIIVLGIVGGLGFGGYYLYTMAFGEPSEKSNAKMLTFEVDQGDLVVTVTEDGSLESANNVDVKCEVAGGSTIISILEDGSFVETGDLVVELDKSTLEDSINQQQNVYEKARATVIQAEQDFEVAKISIEEYEEGTFKQELQDADKQIKIAMENLRNAENTLSHTERMFRKGYVSELELRQKEFAVERSQLELDSAETAKDVLENFTKRKTLEDLKAQRDIAEAKLKSENAAFALEESKLNRLKDQLKKCDVYAPAEGMIVYSNTEGSRFGGSQGTTIEEGAAVRERQSIFKLPDLSKMQVKVNVHESKVENIQRGMPALVRLQGRELQGTVVSIANQPESTSRWMGNIKEYATIVKIDGEPEELKPGMTAEVEILVANLQDVTRVPTSAVVQSGSSYYCWVIEGNKAPEKREIEIGMTDGDYVEIVEGVEVGETVMRNPRNVMQDELSDIDEAEEDTASRFGKRKSPASDGDSKAGDAGEGKRGGRGDGASGRGDKGQGGQRGQGGGGSGGGFSASSMIERLDTDGDGKISKDETPGQMKSGFDSTDTNGDGFLDTAEIEAMIKKYSSGGGAGGR